jgi:DNA primase
MDILRNVGCKTICIMFDGDDAGRNGAKNSIQMAFEKGFKAYDFNPQSKDPKKYNRE